jgi:hypothetical protein
MVVSQSSIFCWRRCLVNYPHTRNQARTTIIGVDLLHLAIYITAWLHATLDEMATFLWNEGGGLFSRQAISRHLKEIGVTQKRASTEAYQAQRVDVQFCVWGFWNCPPPLVIFGVLQRQLINFEEFGVTLEKCNHTGMGY